MKNKPYGIRPVIQGSSNRKYPIKPDRTDKRDIPLAKLGLPQPQTNGVSLKQYCPPINDQGNEGCCSGCGWEEFREYYIIKNNPQSFVKLSKQFIYYQERAMEGNINVDSGAAISDGAMALNKIGVCPETMDPYIAGNYAIPPTQEMITAAQQYKIQTYYRVNDLNGVKQALENGLPVVCGIDVYESFESDDVAATGIIPMPKQGEGYLGGHCVFCMGFKDTSSGILGIGIQGYLMFMNSWGTDWGQQGYFQMPYDVFNYLINDMWTGTI